MKKTLSTPRHSHGMTTIESVVAVAVGTVGLILLLVMLVQYALASYAQRDAAGEHGMTHDAIVERIRPVGDITLYDPNAQQPQANLLPVAATSPTAAAVPGESTFKAVCTGCHGAGVLGAPKFGDKSAWASRIAQGMPVLYTSAIKGKNAMPAKGGNPTLSDDEVKAAVLYMVKAAQ